MHKHPWFNLTIHDDQELAAHLDGEVVERETLHEWPLSFVERVTTQQRQWIYKSQYGPTVEADFYAVARSDLLDPASTIYQAGGYTCTLHPYIDAPLIEDLELTEEQAIPMARQIRAQMDEIGGDLPYLYDISTPGRWLALAENTLHDTSTLIERREYTATTSEMVADLQCWARSDAAIEAIQSRPGHVHGDLTGDNVFVLPDGSYRVIDWQRPWIGPTELDVVSLIESLGFSPADHVSPAMVQVRHFTVIHWFTQCATIWFPEAMENYDRFTVEWVSKLRSLS